MKTIKYLSVLFLSLLVFTACEEDEHDFGQSLLQAMYK